MDQLKKKQLAKSVGDMLPWCVAELDEHLQRFPIQVIRYMLILEDVHF